MNGIRVFRTMHQALEAGYSVYDSAPEGYLVRTRTLDGWDNAIVDLRGEYNAA